MKKQEIEAKNIARKFDIEELFFSTTDDKGIITSCNEVFIKISGFLANELLSKPHNIIRHPEMPRCIFKLFWDFLYDRKAIAAYVKNITKTGEYYWVMALAAPVDEGYLSIRLKPSSLLFEQVRQLYDKLLKTESAYGNDWKEGMKASTLELFSEINKLGYASYDEFMSHAISEELKSREVIMSTNPSLKLNVNSAPKISKYSVSFELLGALTSLKQQLKEKRAFLVNAVKNLTLTSLNSSVRAASFGDQGRTLSVISSEISLTSVQISNQMQVFDTKLSELCGSLQKATMDACLSKLQREMADKFYHEGRNCGLSSEQQIQRYGKAVQDTENMLISRGQTLETSTAESLSRLYAVLEHFAVMIEMFSKIVKTLRFAYVTGKAEASRVSEGESYMLLLEELNTFINETESQLTSLGVNTSSVQQELAVVTS